MIKPSNEDSLILKEKIAKNKHDCEIRFYLLDMNRPEFLKYCRKIGPLL
jgi:hypothetical protein